MDLQQDWAKALSATTSRNLSSSSSAFFSANQSPFFSPRSPTFQGSELAKSDNQNPSSGSIAHVDHIGSSNSISRPENLSDVGFVSAVSPPRDSLNVDCHESELHDHVASSLANRRKYSPSHSHASGSGQKEKPRKLSRSRSYKKFSLARNLATYSSRRLRSYDVYIGFHGRKPSLLRFANWLRAELELQGISCLASDRARCRNSRSHDIVEKAMNASTIGVVILTKRSFGNPYAIEEVKHFLGKKNLFPIFFDMAPGDCLARDIVEMRGESWEKHGGQLWMLYGGLEREWKEAIDGLSRIDEGKLEAQDGNWRDCITRAVLLLATRLGRRGVVEKVNRWKERVEKEEFPFPRNENFIGRKKELSELELMLFGNISGDAEKEYFELKTRHRRRSLVLGWSENRRVEERARDHQAESSSSKGKEPVIWRESEREIEMQRLESPHGQQKNGGRYRRRKRSSKILYGKGIACVSGDSGIGKTELLLEYAYRFSQRYKTVLWIGGESRYFRQNYLNLWPFLEVDVGIENQYLHRGKTKTFEEQEDAAISRIRKELMRDIPFLVVIDNLESEKDWWDKKYVMDLLPRFGGDTHFIISTRLPRIMNLESLKLSYLSGVEAMSLMKGIRDYPIAEIDALSAIEEKLGRLTLGLGIVGAILFELPINPTRLLDTVNRMPPREFIWSSKDSPILRQNNFLLQLLEVCFSIFDHADGPSSLATRMAQVSGWFGPGAIPISLLALAANKVPQKHQGSTKFWKMCWHTLTCGLMQSHSKRSEVEAASMLVRFGIATSRTKEDQIHFHDIVKLYSCKRGASVVAQAAVQAVSYRGFTSLHLEHLWAACFLVFGLGTNSMAVELNVQELLVLVKRVVLPLAIHTFITFSRCNAALELLRVCTDALEAAEDSLVSRVEKWMSKPYCWGSAKSDAQLNPYLWQELAMLRAAVLETRAKLMLKGGHYDIADDLIRKTVHIRASIYGEHHPDTISARETQAKVTRLLTNKEGS